MNTVLDFVAHNLWSPFLAMVIVGAGMAAMERVLRGRR